MVSNVIVHEGRCYGERRVQGQPLSGAAILSSFQLAAGSESEAAAWVTIAGLHPSAKFGL